MALCVEHILCYYIKLWSCNTIYKSVNLQFYINFTHSEIAKSCIRDAWNAEMQIGHFLLWLHVQYFYLIYKFWLDIIVGKSLHVVIYSSLPSWYSQKKSLCSMCTEHLHCTTHWLLLCKIDVPVDVNGSYCYKPFVNNHV